MPTTRMGGLKYKTGREKTTSKRVKTENKMEQQVETNGCADGPTSVAVTNHTDSTQSVKQSEKQLIKPATPSALQEGRSTRHAAGGNRLKRNASVATSHSTKTVSSDKRTTRHSPPMPASSANEKRPVKNSVSSPHKESVMNKRISSLHNVSQPLQTTSSSSSSSSVTNTVVESNTKSNKHQCHSSPSINKKRLKRVMISEPENSVTRMSKRIRLQYQPFQSPPPPTVIPPILRNSQKPTEDKIVVFNKGEFLAVRNENGAFFVCRTAQNVYKSSRRFKIQWLNNDDKDVYIPDFYDYTDFECVLTNLRMKRTDKNKYVLPSEEWKRTMNILQRALNVENGMDIPDPHQVTMDGVDVSIVGNKEEEALIQQQQQKYLKTDQASRSPRVKSRGRPRKTLLGTRKNLRSSDIEIAKQRTQASKRKLQSRALIKAKMRAKQGVKHTESAVRQRRPSSVQVTRKTEKLLPNPDIKVFEKDPTFESSIAVPFISTLADSRLLIRAVLTKDIKLLTSLLSNQDKVCSLNMPRSVDVPYTALSYAVMREDHRMIKKLLSTKLKKYAPVPDNLLDFQGTGIYNIRTLGHAVRRLNMSRGGREGNNAFLKDDHMYAFKCPSVNDEVVELALQRGVSAETINVLIGSTNKGTTTVVNPSQMSCVLQRIAVAVRHGHSKLAAHLISQAVEHDGYGYSTLHRDVLLSNKEDFSNIKVASIIKKSLDGPRITPLHCAAINPNSHHLEALLYKSAEYTLPDKDGWRPIHYAAVCESTSALEVLLSRDISYEEVTDNAGTTPLHAACMAGRVKNVDLILSHSSVEHSTTTKKNSPVTPEKFGVGGIDRPNKKSYCSIHIAAEKGYCDIVKALIRHGANIQKTTSAIHEKLTPMMLAAQQGHLDVVKILVESGAPVEAKDKYLRTALTHSIFNGHAHIASYLLWLGADKNTKDSSGNTLIHYAAAYGWYFCLKLLIEAGMNPNSLNDWKMTPLSLAFLKGHMGLVDVLLAEPGINTNVPIDDEKGITLMMKTVQSRITPSMLDRLKFLTVRQKCDCNVIDYFGNNVLHHFVYSEISELKRLDEKAIKVNAVGCSTSSELNCTEEYDMEERMAEFFQEEIRKEHDTVVKEIANLLLEHGCDPKLVNKEGESPFSLAVREGCMLLVEIFMNAGCELTLGVCVSSKNTVLHSLVQYAREKEVTPLLKLIMRNNNQTENSNHSLLSEMTKMYNKNGFTPLLLAVNSMETCDLVTADRMLKLIEFMINELGADVQAPVKNAEGQDISTILHLAAKCKASEIFDILLPHNPLLDVLDSKKLTPLLACIKSGDGEPAAKLVRGGCNVNIKSATDDNRSPLLLAARHGNLGSLVQLLLQHKADSKEVDPKNGFTALHYVVNQRPSDVLETAKALIDAGASVNAVNNDQQTPLHLAVNSHVGGADAFYDLEEYLLSCGAKTDACDKHGRVALHYAFIDLNKPDCCDQIDPIELVALLTNAMGSVSPDIADNNGQTPLHIAAYRGAAVSCLHLSLKMKNIDARDKDGNTPLGLAVMNGHKSCALALLQKGCSCTAEIVSLPKKNLSEDKEKQPWAWHHLQGKPPQIVKYPIIQEAARRDWEEIVFLMLDQLENVGKGYTVAIEAALKTAKYHLALKLIPKVKHSWTLYSEKQSPFHILARQPESELQLKVAQALIDKGVPLMAKDEHGCSVTIYSALKWNASLLSFICDKVGTLASIQADPDKSLRTPVSALFWQLGDSNISLEIRSLFVDMIKEGANPNILTRYPLCEMPYPGVRCTMLDKLHEEISSAPQFSPLMVAIYRKNFHVVKLLLKHGANVNFCDDQQRTPVMHAAKLNDIKMVKLLLNHSYKPSKDDPYSEKSLKSFRKTSSVDLSLKDNRGWTVVHHAISPSPEFFHVQTTLLKLLAQVGAPLDTANNLGETPLQLALRNQAENVVETLQNVLNVAREKREKVHIKFPSPGGIVLDLGVQPWDYRQDSKALQETCSAKSVVQRSCEPDKESDMTDTGEVIVDERKIPYNVLMVNVDLKYGAHGLYNFYKMQLIRHKNKDFYVLFTRWGRVGGLGQHQKTPFHKLEEAVKEFCDIFRKKSGNLWENVQNFQQQPKKYNLVSLEKRVHVQQKDIKIKLTNNVPSKLPACLEKLLRDLMDVHMLKEALSNMGCDSGTPFGTLSENSLKEAEEILKTASEVVTEIDKLEINTKTQRNYDELAKKILELSEQFYRLVPLYGYQYEEMVLLSERSEIENQMKVIHDLMHISLSGDLLLGAQYRNKEINPADYVYKCLGCQMELLDRDSKEAQLVLQYIHNTSDDLSPKVEAIFSVFQERESANAKELNNHMMLWHGTKVSNLLGILKRGLQVAPIGILHAGAAFGKGIYFADMFAKSRSYCSCSLINRSRYMLLCEVALGDMKEINTSSEPPKEADSIKVLGFQQPSPSCSISWNGCTWPVGPSVDYLFEHEDEDDTSADSDSDDCKDFLHFSEYVVRRPSQVCIRYLIQFYD